MSTRVLLYYKFARLSDLPALRESHQAFCEANHLKGRVYIALEGINGTVAGSIEATEAYKNYLGSIPEFKGIEFKEDTSEHIPFEKMKTKIRPYVLNMGFKPDEDIDPSQITGNHLSPAQWRKVLETEKDFVLLDIRNNYESAIGHFEGVIYPDLKGFTEFPDWLNDLEKYKDKKVLMYCTGGIRCEKYSGLLLKNGFKDVNQLHGGILNYFKEEDGAHFKGKCFVFDDRLVVSVGGDSKPIAQCKHCQKPDDRYVNCANMECNELFIVCDDCAAKTHATCCEACFASSAKRPFHADTFRIPFRSKGKVFPELGRRQIHEMK